MRYLKDMLTIKRLLEGAEREARGMGEEEPGAEHLLLSALQLPDGAAQRLLGVHGVDHDRLRAAIIAEHARALVGIGMDEEHAKALASPRPLEPAQGGGVFHSRPSAQEAFRAAASLAQQRRRTALNGAHVVAAVAEMEHGTAARALDGLGIDRRGLAAAARRAINPESFSS